MVNKFTSLFLVLLLSCNNSEETPEKVVQNFIISLKKADFEKAGSYISSNSKMLYEEFKTQYQGTDNFRNQLLKKEVFNEENIMNDFDLRELISTINNNNAIVMSKDSSNQVLLEKNQDNWKLICTKEILEGIIFSEEAKSQVLAKFNELHTINLEKVKFIQESIQPYKDIIADSLRKNINETLKIKPSLSLINSYSNNQIKFRNSLLLLQNKYPLLLNISYKIDNFDDIIASKREDLNKKILEHNILFGKKIEYYTADRQITIPSVKF